MENRKTPRISVIIPVYNSERFVAQAIDSVVNQTLKPTQIIVVDDGSTDRSTSIIKSYPEVSYHYQVNGGVSSALNTGLKLVAEDYIAFLDSDDYWELDKLEKQMLILDSDESLCGVFGYHKRFYEKADSELTQEERTDGERILPAYFKASLLIRKNSFFKVGFFDEKIHMGDFLDWYRRAMDMGMKFGMVNDVLFHRRIHDANTSLKNKAEIGAYVRLLKASIDRRRSSGNA